MDKASEAILSLKPVTFRYKHELDPTASPVWPCGRAGGKGEPRSGGPGRQGKPYTVRYEAVNAMLLNEFLKEHRKVEEQAVNTITTKVTREQQHIGSSKRD